jgi:nucleotide-binding universal stress UspA family protein
MNSLAWQHILIGSVAEHVVHLARIPVNVVKASHDD